MVVFYSDFGGDRTTVVGWSDACGRTPHPPLHRLTFRVHSAGIRGAVLAVDRPGEGWQESLRYKVRYDTSPESPC